MHSAQEIQARARLRTTANRVRQGRRKGLFAYGHSHESVRHCLRETSMRIHENKEEAHKKESSDTHPFRLNALGRAEPTHLLPQVG